MGKEIWLHPFSMGYLASIMNQKWKNKKQDLQAGESWCKNSNSTTLEQKKKEKKTVNETSYESIIIIIIIILLIIIIVIIIIIITTGNVKM